MASDDMKKLIQLMESAPAKVADEELDEMFFYPDTRSREEKNRAANKPQDILGRRPEQAIAKHGKEFKAMKKGTSPQDAADRERYGLGGPKGKLPENAIQKIYRNSDGSATVVLESGDAYWYESDFVNEYMLNESGKVDRNMLNEAVRAGFVTGNGGTIDSGDPTDPETKMHFRRPETNAERNLLAAQIKKARAYNRSSMDYEKNTGADQSNADQIANLAPLQRGVKSSQVYDYQQRSNTPPGMAGHDGYRHIGTGAFADQEKASNKAYDVPGADSRTDKFGADVNTARTSIGVLDTNKPNRALKVKSSASDGRSGYMPASRRPTPRPQRPEGL